MKVVFWSWQSQLSNKCNRNFIEDCIKKAIKNLEKDKENSKIVIDRDTKGTSGAVDIASTIYKKIEKSDVFIADVSIVHKHSEKDKTRYYPNSNVLLELGYAAGKIGFERVILVINTATGDTENLPFDLRPRRSIRYNLDDNSNNDQRWKIKEKLVKDFENAIKIILGYELEEKIIENQRFVKNLSNSLIRIRILCQDLYDSEIINVENIKPTLSREVNYLNSLSRDETAIENNYSDLLLNSSQSLDDIVGFRIYLGCGDKLNQLIDNTMKIIDQVWNTIIVPGVNMISETEKSVVTEILKNKQELIQLLTVYEKWSKTGRRKQLISSVSDVGRKLLEQCLFIGSNRVGEKITNCAWNLHRQQYKHRTIDSGRSMILMKGLIETTISEIEAVY